MDFIIVPMIMDAVAFGVKVWIVAMTHHVINRKEEIIPGPLKGQHHGIDLKEVGNVNAVLKFFDPVIRNGRVWYSNPLL